MEIIWTNKALNSYDVILEDIIAKFPIEVAIEFDLKAESLVLNLEEFPEMGNRYKNTAYRRFVIAKLISLFYRIDTANNIIYLSFFWLNRDNPKELIKMLSS